MFDGLYHPFMVIRGIFHYCYTNIRLQHATKLVKFGDLGKVTRSQLASRAPTEVPIKLPRAPMVNYPLVIYDIANWKMASEIVDFPMKNDDVHYQGFIISTREKNQTTKNDHVMGISVFRDAHIKQ